MRPAPVLVLVAVGLASFIVAGCTSPTVDGDLLARRLTADLQAGSSDVQSVSCPAGQPAKPDTRFACTATLTAGGGLVYDVTITSEQGAYTYALGPNQRVDPAALAEELRVRIAGAAPALASTLVTCPEAVLAPGGAVSTTCTAAIGGAQVPVAVTGAPGRPLDWRFAAT